MAVSIAWATLGSGAVRAAEFITIGTGGVTGVYFPAGGAICRLVNKDRKDHGVRCSVESTFGSVFNINAIRSGDLDLGLAQSDTQYGAVRGEAPFDKRGPYPELRSVFSLHAEPVTLMARADAKIRHINDVKGRRMNIGNPGSGTLATWQVIEQALGWKRRDLALAAEFKANQQGEALCDNKIDAFFTLVGHPSAATRETAT
ncbi:MAG: TAXI family TRAP transporter solute-binding subunit, partial [Rhodospirillales bacterium]